MKQEKQRKTFKALYEEAKGRPTPARAFVREVARVTLSSENTVYNWISGLYTPGPLAVKAIADHLGVPPEGLFPKE